MAKYTLRQFNQMLLDSGLFSDLVETIKEQGCFVDTKMTYTDTAEHDRVAFTLTKIKTFEIGELNIDETVLVSDSEINFIPFICDLIEIKYYNFDEFEHSYLIDKDQIGNELIAVIGLNSIEPQKFNVKKFKSYIQKTLSNKDLDNIYQSIFDMFNLNPIQSGNDYCILNDDSNFKSIVYKLDRIPKDREKLFAIINKGKNNAEKI